MKLFNIETCNGNSGCPNSVINTDSIVEELNKIAVSENIEEIILSKIKGPIRQHNAFRVAIANCPNACSQVQIKDIGIIAKVKINIDFDKCVNCGKCAKVCFERALTFKDKKLHFNKDLCIGCGMCFKVCKEGAIEIVDKGFQVLAGGKLGRHPMLTLDIAEFVSENEVIEIFKKILDFYKKHSIVGERLGAIFQRMKIDNDKIKNIFK